MNQQWTKVKDLKDSEGNYVHCKKKFKTVKELILHMANKHPTGCIMIDLKGNDKKTEEKDGSSL